MDVPRAIIIDGHLLVCYRPPIETAQAVMQSAVANGKLDGQSVHGPYSTTSGVMWHSTCSDESNSTSAAAADCRAIVPMLSGINLSLISSSADFCDAR